MTRVLVAGETLVDFLPESTGPLSSVESFSRRPGGAPANVAVGLARLDAELAFWTRIGEDPFGDFLADALAEQGVPGTYVERDSEAKTTLAFVSLGEDADREFSFYRERAADTRMEPGAIPDDELADFGWVHFDVLSLDTEPSRSAALDLASRARDAGATVSFDPNARPERWTDFSYAQEAREGFALADVVKATPEDLREAGFEGDAPDLARAVCEHGPHTALVTLGGEGSYAYATADAPWAAGETETTHGGYDVEPVDTTGAGDAFTAGVVAALSEGKPLADALAFGNAVAALTTTAAGAMTALPTRDEVREFVG
ncbi:carbohydrate kinase family protein [Halegenticoccus soli]|uniref:carbohydrate kinase family protein n=1 Tax=Halegenticoccus soli TaxID=1985678 RepID=UPI000C6D94C9|nr:carbohydrate kinase [Halegenticoccus soli]